MTLPLVKSDGETLFQLLHDVWMCSQLPVKLLFNVAPYDFLLLQVSHVFTVICIAAQQLIKLNSVL